MSELKNAFAPVYHEELAFKKLEAYSQTENQSICNFYNEIIKLCNDADPTMTESTKLKHLLNKTKSTLQFEVRRKKPTTTKEFLEYAKDVEELFQLTRSNTNINFNNYNSHPNSLNPTAIISPPMTSTTFNDPTQQHSYTTYPSRRNNFNSNYSPRHYNNTYRSSFSVPYPNNSFQSQNTTPSSNEPGTSQVYSNRSSNWNRPKVYQHHNQNQDTRSNHFQRSGTSGHPNSSQHNLNGLMHSDYDNPKRPIQQSLSTDKDFQPEPANPSLQSNPNF